MNKSYQILFSLAFAVFLAHSFGIWQTVAAQEKPLDYLEIQRILLTPVPNDQFPTKGDRDKFLINEILRRRVTDQPPFTDDIRDQLKKAGATEFLLNTIKTNIKKRKCIKNAGFQTQFMLYHKTQINTLTCQRMNSADSITNQR